MSHNSDTISVLIRNDLTVIAQRLDAAKTFPAKIDGPRSFEIEQLCEEKSLAAIRNISSELALRNAITADRCRIFLALPIRSLVKIDLQAQIAAEEIKNWDDDVQGDNANSPNYEIHWPSDQRGEGSERNRILSDDPFTLSVQIESDLKLFSQRLLFHLSETYFTKGCESEADSANPELLVEEMRALGIPRQPKVASHKRGPIVLFGGGIDLIDRLLLVLISKGKIISLPARYFLCQKRKPSSLKQSRVEATLPTNLEELHLSEFESWAIEILAENLFKQLLSSDVLPRVFLRVLEPKLLAAVPQNLHGLELLDYARSRGISTSMIQHGATYGESVPTTWERYETSEPDHFLSWNIELGDNPIPALTIQRRARLIFKAEKTFHKNDGKEKLRLLHVAPANPSFWFTPFRPEEDLNRHSALVCSIIHQQSDYHSNHRPYPRYKGTMSKENFSSQTEQNLGQFGESIIEHLAWADVVVVERMLTTTLLECVLAERTVIIFDPFSFEFMRPRIKDMYTELKSLGLWVSSSNEFIETLNVLKNPIRRVELSRAQQEVVMPYLLTNTSGVDKGNFPLIRQRLTNASVMAKALRTFVRNQELIG